MLRLQPSLRGLAALLLVLPATPGLPIEEPDGFAACGAVLAAEGCVMRRRLPRHEEEGGRSDTPVGIADELQAGVRDSRAFRGNIRTDDPAEVEGLAYKVPR